MAKNKDLKVNLNVKVTPEDVEKLEQLKEEFCFDHISQVIRYLIRITKTEN